MKEYFRHVHSFNADLAWGFRIIPVVGRLAFDELKAKYKRTLLGPFWILLSLAFGSVGLGILWSHLWNVPYNQMIPNITFGFLIWTFIAGSIVDSTLSFSNSSVLIRNMKLPVCFFPLICFARQLISFFHSFIIMAVVLCIFPPENALNLLLVIPALILMALVLFLICFLIGALSARYRDIPPLITALMPMLFFLTPVLFKAKQAGDYAWLIWLNPFTYLITLIRDPLLGRMPDLGVILMSTLMSLGLYIALCILIAPKLKKIVFWI